MHVAWFAYLPLTLSVAGLIPSLTHYDDCPAHPSLWAFLLVFFILVVCSNTWKFVFGVPFRMFSDREDVPITKTERFAQLFLDPVFMFVSIWGAVLTWSDGMCLRVCLIRLISMTNSSSRRTGSQILQDIITAIYL